MSSSCFTDSGLCGGGLVMLGVEEVTVVAGVIVMVVAIACIPIELQLTVHQSCSANWKLEQGRTREHQTVCLASTLARCLGYKNCST